MVPIPAAVQISALMLPTRATIQPTKLKSFPTPVMESPTSVMELPTRESSLDLVFIPQSSVNP